LADIPVDQMHTAARARRDLWTSSCSWREVREISGCEWIFSPTINLVVWRRPLDPELGLLVAQGQHPGESWQVILPMTADERMQPTPAIAQLPAPWFREIAVLAELLCSLTGGSQLGLRWQIADKAMCPRFHSDRTTLRLVCTYRGAGTEWLDEQDVDRQAAGQPRARGAWPSLERPGATIQGAAIGEVVLLKGDAWPGNRARGAVHRSPPVAPGSSRLLLTLDVL